MYKIQKLVHSHHCPGGGLNAHKHITPRLYEVVVVVSMHCYSFYVFFLSRLGRSILSFMNSFTLFILGHFTACFMVWVLPIIEERVVTCKSLIVCCSQAIIPHLLFTYVYIKSKGLSSALIIYGNTFYTKFNVEYHSTK